MCRAGHADRAGLGNVQPRALAGAASPEDPPAAVLSDVGVTIGGVPAPVFFAGLTPRWTGLYQINVFVPPDAPRGGSVPLVARKPATRVPR